MHIVIASHTRIPVVNYGGTERVIWDLGRALVDLGHRVTYLVAPGSKCDFAPVIHFNDKIDLREQIPKQVDIIHFHFRPSFDPDGDFEHRYLFTEHGNSSDREPLPLNTVFLSANHAERHGSVQFVHNGMDWRHYGVVDFNMPRDYFHFLGKAAWRVKNVSGAIDVALMAGSKLSVLGGHRLNFKRGFRFTISPRIKFYGMVGGETKLKLLNGSAGLIFPVRWHEPFGLAVIESLYFGCAVFATPYGSLPEIVTPDCGTLSDSCGVLAEAVSTSNFNPYVCHRRAITFFSAEVMCRNYLEKYERVLSGEEFNSRPPVLKEGFKNLPWNA